MEAVVDGIVTLGDDVTCTRRELQPTSETAFVFERSAIRRFKRELTRLVGADEVDEATYELTSSDGVLPLRVSLSDERMFLELELAEDERVRYYSYRTARVHPVLTLDRTHMTRLETQLSERAEVQQGNHVVYGILDAEGVPRLYVMCTDSHVILGDLVHRAW